MDYKQLLKKYDVPVPRYTSYPTVPYWSESPTSAQWLESLARTASQSSPSSMALYVHIPFCESLCTFCGCNTMITRTHEREHPYVQKVLRELDTYVRAVPALRKVPVREIHLGGGTPTFLSASHLHELVSGLLKIVTLDPHHFSGAVEIDPRRTNREQLKALRQLGFNRVSLGVQDFDPEVQRLVNRIQPIEMTRELTLIARELGYTSINYDLIYGLPKQTLASMQTTLDHTVALRPDRIALYSLAIVPWIKPAQRLFKDEDLPMGAEKRELFELAYTNLKRAGYVEIGMDHFALPTDELTKAMTNGSLHRNFMGYADSRTDILLGLGVSSISETPDCFHQNEKVLPLYEKKVDADEVATLRGHILNADDQFYREQILKFMTQGQVRLRDAAQAADVADFLQDMIEDRLVTLEGQVLALTDSGRPFLRNACVALDMRLRHQKPETRVFSQAL